MNIFKCKVLPSKNYFSDKFHFVNLYSIFIPDITIEAPIHKSWLILTQELPSLGPKTLKYF